MAPLSPTGVPDREALREFVRTYRTSGAGRGKPTGAADANCIVEVDGYTRTRNGKSEQVGGYRRNNPYCGGGADEEQLVAFGAMRFVGQQVPGLRGGPVRITASGLAAAAHREGARTVRRYLDHRNANLPTPTSIRGRGDLSKFNEVERRLRAFADTQYEMVWR
jgi:hypothetical protein